MYLNREYRANLTKALNDYDDALDKNPDADLRPYIERFPPEHHDRIRKFFERVKYLQQRVSSTAFLLDVMDSEKIPPHIKQKAEIDWVIEQLGGSNKKKTH